MRLVRNEFTTEGTGLSSEKENAQQELLTKDGQPAVFVCPSCRGNKQVYRLYYPNEIPATGETGFIGRCRACQGTGTVSYNPDDHSEIPY
jgi:hypothetical protein